MLLTLPYYKPDKSKNEESSTNLFQLRHVSNCTEKLLVLLHGLQFHDEVVVCGTHITLGPVRSPTPHLGQGRELETMQRQERNWFWSSDLCEKKIWLSYGHFCLIQSAGCFHCILSAAVSYVFYPVFPCLQLFRWVSDVLDELREGWEVRGFFAALGPVLGNDLML